MGLLRRKQQFFNSSRRAATAHPVRPRPPYREVCTMAAHLRVFSTAEPTDLESPEPTVAVSLGDLLPLLALAHRKNYVWLQDFLDDEVRITSDLHEILQSFRRRPCA
jgi:hypothetical protein